MGQSLNTPTHPRGCNVSALVVGCTLLLLAAMPVQAQTQTQVDIWTSTLTVGEHGRISTLVGLTGGDGSLTDSDVVINGVTYTITTLQLDTESGNLRLATSPAIPNDDRTDLALHVGTTKFDFPSGTGLINWPNSGLSWSTGDTISLKIVETIPPGVAVTPTDISVTEGDTTGGSYDVVLQTEPTASVTVTVGGHSGTDLTVSPSTLTFTTSNWSTAQTVTVTAGQDSDSVNDTVTLTHGVSGYGTVTTGNSVSVTVVDDELSLFDEDVDYGNLITYGPGSSGNRTWTLDLNGYLHSGVTGVTFAVSSCSADRGDYFAEPSVSGSMLTLTTNSLGHVHGVGAGHTGSDRATTCTISATKDTAVSTSDFTFQIVPPGSVPSPASVSTVGTPVMSFRINGGGGARYVRLGIRRTGGSGAPQFYYAGGVTSTTNLTIPGLAAGTYDVRAYLMHRAAFELRAGTTTPADGVLTRERSVPLKWSGRFESNGVSLVPKTLRNVSTEATRAVTISDAQALEGSSMTFTVTLSAAPGTGQTARVFYHLSDNLAAGDSRIAATANTDYPNGSGSVVFGATDTTQTITVATTQDTTSEPDEVFRVLLSNASSGYYIADREADGTIIDNDRSAGVTVTPTELDVVEGGSDSVIDIGGGIRDLSETATYTVVLDSAPSANVTVTVTGVVAADMTVAPTTLTFTTSNWHTAQTVTVTAVDDTVAESLQEDVTLMHAVSGYGSVTTADSVVVHIFDYEEAETPGAPTSFAATAGDAAVTLSWAAPASDGGGAITEYEYRYSAGAAVSASATWTDVTDGSDDGNSTADETGVTVSGLTNGTQYAFEVRAVNSAGDGTAAGPVTATPASACAAPSFGTRRNIWTGSLTVGITSTFSNGFDSAHGSLDDKTFTIGSNNYEIDAVRVASSGSSGGDLSFSLKDSALTSAEKAALRLHVCNAPYDFSAGDLGRVSHSYTFSANLDWSSLSSRTLYLSLPANTAATGTPTITAPDTDPTTVGSTLTATTGDIADTDGLPTTFTYQWSRVDADGTSNEEDIAGATASTYLLAAADVGKKVTVSLTFTDTLGSEETRASAVYPASGTIVAAVAVCAAPDFGTRRSIWTGALTVEPILFSGSTTVAYGFSTAFSPTVGALDDKTFSIGANSYEIDTATVLAGRRGTNDGDITFGLKDSNLTTAEKAALRLHVCDTAYDFSAATGPSSSHGYAFAADLDWSGLSSRILYLSLPANSAATGTPTITAPDTDPTTVGSTLTATTGDIADTDGLPTTFTYQWSRVDADGTSNEEDIAGATASTYVLAAADVGKKVTVSLTFTDDLGSEETRTSAVYPASGTIVAAVAVCAAPDFGTRRNIWTGALTVAEFTERGATAHGFNATNGALDDKTFGLGANNYEILLIAHLPNERSISLNLNSNLTTLERSVLKLHVCDVALDFSATQHISGQKTYLFSVASIDSIDWSSVDSRTLYLSLPANSAATGAPTITAPDTDPTTVGSTLTATTGDIADTDGLPTTFTYQWSRVDADGTSNKEAIAGATASTYVLAAADVGKKVTVSLTFTDNLGSEETRTSAVYPASGTIVAAVAVCAAPNFGTRRNIWTGAVTVEPILVSGSTVAYGFSTVFSPTVGALDDKTFSIGSSNHEIDEIGVHHTGFADADEGDLDFSLNAALTTGEKAALRLHVCNAAFDFNAATLSSTTQTYKFTTDLDWSGLSSRILYLSLPANTAATGTPTITAPDTDPTTVGSTLTATTGDIADTDGLPTTFTYQWSRVDADGTSNKEAIAGATASTYRLAAADVGKKVTVALTFTDDLGSEETRTSAVYPSSGTIVTAGSVCAAPEFGTRRNIWTGTVTVGTLMSGGTTSGHGFDRTTGNLDDKTFSIGANSYEIDTATVLAGRIGTNDGDITFGLKDSNLTTAEKAALRLHVCDTAYDFSAATGPGSTHNYFFAADLDWSGVSSRTLYLSLPANTAATGTPTITAPDTDPTTVGTTLTATSGDIADTDGLPGSFTYQWSRVDADGTSNREDIAGATASTYRLAAADVGKKVTVALTFTDTLGSEETRTSALYPSSDTIVAAGSAGVTLSRSDLTVDEGSTGTYTVVLNSQPTGDVTVTPSVTGDSDITVSPSTLTFTTTNWNTAQEVTVSAAEDADSADDNATIAHAVVGADYASVIAADVSVTVTDNDSTAPTLPTITIAAGTTPVTEGTAAAFTLTRSGATTAALTVAVTVTETGEMVAEDDEGAQQVTFEAGSATATLSVTTLDDTADETDSVVTATLVADTDPATYTPGTPASVTVTVEDDDEPIQLSWSFSPLTQTVVEGDAATVTLQITADRKPSESVGFRAGTRDDTASVADFRSVRRRFLSVPADDFSETGGQYIYERTYTIDTVDDALVENDEIFRFTMGTPSAFNEGFAVTSGTPAEITITDNDTAEVTISTPALSVGEGGSDSYTVVLTSQPTGDVTVTPSVTGDSDVTVSAALTFTTTNWDTAQTVTVSAAEDADSTDDSATIAHAVTGADYALVAAAGVTVTVTDNDSADSTAPRVASIVRQSPAASPTNADSLSWRLIFSEAVENVDAADFALSGSTATLAVSAVSASEYTVTASGGDLAGFNGTVTLSFAAGQNIQDLAGNALANTTPTGANNADYVIDNTAPTLAISGVPATSDAPFTATFTFSEDITGFVAGDISLVNATLSAFTTTSGAVYTARVTPTADGTVTLNVAADAAQDTAGNSNTAVARASSIYTASALPVITISAGTTPVTEGTAAAFTLRRTGATTAALTVSVGVTESGAVVAETEEGTKSVTFAIGSATATLSVATVDDTAGENGSMVTATVVADTMAESNPATYTPGTPASATVTVADNDGGLPALSIAASSPSVTEGTDAVFVVRASAPVTSDLDVTVQVQASPTSQLTMPGGLSLSGTAGTRVDIGPVRIPLGQSEATIRIPSGPVLQIILGGVVSQGYLTATLVNTPAYGVETPGFAEVRLDAMVHPADELPVVSLALQDTASAVTEGDTIEFVVSRPAPPAPLQLDDLLALEVNVRYHLRTAGVSDPVVDTVTLEAGILEKIVTIPTLDNEVVDPGRVLTVALVPGTGYTISDTAASAAVTILDDDFIGFVVEFVQSELTLEEDVHTAALDSLPIQVRISGPSRPGPMEVILFDIKTVAGTATEADYLPLDFPRGVSAQRREFSQGSDGTWTAIQTYPMASIADRVDEPDEQFTVVLSRVRAFPSTFADVSLGATTEVTVTIADDDEPNTAPTAADGTVTTEEDTAYTFRAGDFNFADADIGHVLDSVRVVSLPTAGALTLDSAAVTAGQAIATGDLGDLAFTPAADANGAAYANFTFRVSDGIEHSEAANTITIAVTAVNDAPTGRPTVAGTAQVGETLSALVSEIADADGLGGASFTYQWWRVDADGSSNPLEITGETGTTYVLTTADIGKRIQVAVRYSDDDGTAEGPLGSAAWPSSGTVTAVVLPTITIASDTTPVTEGTAARFTLRRTGATTDALTVSVRVTESGAVVAVAEEGTKSVTFEIGEATAALSVATVDDRIDAADSVVTATVAADSADPATYTPGSPASATVTVADDDSAGVTVSESALTVAEGTTGTYTMVLTSQPTGEVTVTPSSDNREVTLSPATLSFTATNWNNAQMVTVSAAEDADSADDSATIAHSVAGADYTAVTATDVAVTVTDNDSAGVTVSTPTLSVGEGGTGTYTVVLTSQPTAEVTVTPSVTGDSDVTVSAALTFTTSNWNTAQTLTVSAAEDADSADDSATIAHGVAGADYALVTAAEVSVTVTDNDPADSTAPRVVSIVRQVPTTSPTNADSLTWLVTFSEAVRNVDMADFALSGSTATLAVAAVSSVMGGYDITASGGDLAGFNGTVTLSFAAGQNIQDLAGNALANTTPTGANNADYVIDNTAPTLAISGVPATSDAPFTATFTFSEAVTGFAVDDITPDNATLSAFTTTSGAVYTALITPTADGTVTLDVAADVAQDEAGNGNSAATRASSRYTAPVAVLPVITISAGATPVTEGTAAAFTLSRTGATTAALTVGVNVTETGEMVAAANKGTQSVTFETGSASATLSVATLGDTTGENDSVVTATVAADTANPATYTPDTPTLAAVTVSDDDGGLPALLITASSPSVTEGTDAVFVVRSAAPVPSNLDVTVQIQASPTSQLTMPGGLSLSGTAGTRVDIGPVRILSGQSEATIRIPSGPVLQIILGGVVSQGYLTATLVNTPAYGVETPGFAEVRLDAMVHPADELPVVSLALQDTASTVTEGDTIGFVISRPAPPAPLQLDDLLALEVNVRYHLGTAGVSDPVVDTVTLEAGTLEKVVTISIPDNEVVDPGRVLTVALVPGTGYTISDTAAAATVTVVDNDGGLPTLSITASSPSVTEGTDAVFVVRSAAPVSSNLDVTVQIQASPASQLTMPGGLSMSGTTGTRVDIGPVRILSGQSEATIRIPSGPVLQIILGGVVSQGYLTATLVNTPAYGVETPGFAEVRLDAMVHPADELPVVSLALQDTASAVTEGDTIEFVVSRPAPPAPLQVDDLLALEVNVRYHLSTDGVNDPVVDTVTLEAGTLEKIVTISIPDNEVVDPGRVLTIALVSGTGYTISDTAASAAVTIIDDDGFVVEFVQSTLTLEEDVDSRSNSLPIEVRISGPRQPGPREFILFDIKTVAGTATEADYRPLNFPNGVSAQRFEFSQGSDGVWTAIQTYQMTSIADRVDEPDEQFTVVLSRVRAVPSTFADVSLGATTRVTVTIADNDEPNTAPTAADGTVTTVEDTAYTFRAGDFNFADTDTGHVLESVRVVSLPTAGALTLDGVAVTAGQAIATGDLGDLAFTPAADANGAAYANFTFHVSDGIEDSAAANTITIAVTAVNDAPTGQPTVAGTAQVGETLSALVSEIADADGLSGASFTYQWWRVDADGSSNPVEITGETGTTYVLTTADIGKRIQVAVRYSDDDGTAEGPLSSAAWPSSGTVTAVVLPTITIASDTTPVTEGTAARFTLSRTGATTDALTVSVSVTESGAVVAVAEEGTKSVTFEIGEATAALSVATVDDRIDAADSVVTATVADDSADPATYTPGSPASATVTVADDDSAGVTVSESALTVAEGTTGTYTMVLTSQPTGEVTVTPSSDNREVTLSPATLSFTATNWNNAQMVTVSAAEDADSADDSATIAHSVAGADYALVTAANVAVTVTDNDDEIVANHPATGAPVIEGALTMASVLTADTSQIRDADGLDGVVYQYQWLRIDGAGNGRGEREIAGATEGTYRISEQDIGHRLRLRVAFADARGNPEQLYSAPTAAVSVVSREVAQAWLGRFGRTVSEQVLTVVDGRLHSSREAGSSLRLAGHEMAQESADKAGYKPDDGWGWRVRDKAEEGLYGAYGGRGVSGREWLTGSSFNVTSGSEAGDYTAFWGGVAANRFSGQQDVVTIEGEVISGQMGADWRRRWGTAGLLLSHARGEGDYRVDDDSGEIESTLTGVYPFVGYTLNDRTSLWGVAGYGSGESRYRSADGGGWYTSDLSLSLAAAGIRTVVRPTVAGSGLELSLVADGLLLRAESDASLGIAAESARVNRVRTGLEGRWHGLGSGLTPVLELGLRHDSGDIEKGFGADLGGGVDWHRGRFELQVRGRGLLTHEDSAFRNRGFSGMMSWQSQPSSSYGLKLRMQQSVGGSATGGVAALHGRETIAGLHVSGSSQESPLSPRTEMSVAYGMPVGRYFIGTPEVGLGITDQQQDYRVGWRLDLRRNREIDFALGLEVRRRENLETEDAGYEATLQLRANW